MTWFHSYLIKCKQAVHLPENNTCRFIPEVKTIVAQMATVACSWRQKGVGWTGFNWW